MEKKYLLLRDNIQRGPYSLSELLQQLQSDDLIWVLQRSNSWCYPEELPELKADEIKSKETENKPQQKSTSVKEFLSLSHQNHKSVYVSLPPQQQLAQEKEVTSLTFDERVDKMRKLVDQVSQSKSTGQQPDLHVNYIRSLESIKEDYVSWMSKSKIKYKQSILLKQVSIAALCILVIAASFFTARFFLKEPLIEAISTNTTSSLPVQSKDAEHVLDPVLPESQKEQVSTDAEPPYTDLKIVHSKTKQTSKQPKQDSYASSVKKVVSKRGSGVDDNTSVIAPVENKQLSAAAISKQILLNANYINTGKGAGVGGLSVKLRNNSSQILKMVAVDVIYYKDLDNVLARKTLYFSNVQPGQEVIKEASGNKDAEGAFARLGLISAEGGNVFYASN